MNTPASSKVEQLVECADYLISLYKRLWHGGVVRDLAEAECAYETAKREATLTPAPSGEGREASGILEALDQALEQFSEPMSALNPHELGERLANDVAEIVRHARARSALLAPHKDTNHD